MAYRVVPDRQGVINIGKIKENLVTEVELPAPGFGGGSYAVLLRRPKEEQPYPVAARHEGSTLVWTVQTADTAIAGTGKLECRWYGDNGEVAKSQTYMVRITDGLPDPTEAPEAWEGFMGQVARNAETAQAAAEAAKTAQSGAEAAKLAAGESATGAAGSAEAAAQAAQKSEDLYNQVKDDLAAGKLKGEKGDPGKDAPQIDDNTVSADSPWSSRKIVETLCPPLEETGNPVTCYPVAGYPLGVVASWEPTQAGEGEPYPAGGGPNLLDISRCTATVGKPYGLTITIDGDIIKCSGVPSAEVTITQAYSFAVASSGQEELRGKGYKVTAWPIKGKVSNAWGLRTADESSLAIAAELSPGVDTDIQLRLMVSKDTPTAYAPYENIRPISGRDAVKVERCGRNLIKPIWKSKSESGISYIVNDDYSITIRGTATARSYIKFFDFNFVESLVSGTYTLCTLTNLPTGISIFVGHYDGTVYAGVITGISPGKNHVTFAAKGVHSLDSYIETKSGVTVDTTVYLMLVPGSTPPVVYTPYHGDTLSLALPRTIYGGTVDAVTGAGAETWKLLTLDGTEKWEKYGNVSEKAGASCFYFGIDDKDIGYGTSVCNKFLNTKNSDPFNNVKMKKFTYTDHPSIKNIYMNYGDDQTVTLDEWKAYLAAQAAAGTPVQIAYKLAEPVAFRATGIGPLLPIPGETNTIMTDADSVSVTGRADPIRIIQQLQAAQSAAAAQLDETQQAVVDTTAMAVDYIYEQDSKIFGGDDDDDQTDAVPT